MSRAPRRVRLDLAYDGTDFEGWQFQPRRRTVQGVVEEALTRLCGGRPVKLRAAGRTDAGVHALAQVADGEVAIDLDDGDLAYALRRILPPDVRPRSVATVEPTFNSRYHAKRKTYHYRLDLSRHGNPLIGRYAWHVPHALDVNAIGEALAALPGRRDFSGFAASKCDKQDRVRTLDTARYEVAADEQARFVFAADGFLTYMVRNIVGTAVEIGRGRLPLRVVGQMLADGDRGLGGPTAPAHGLCLVEVSYGGAGRFG